MKNIKYVILGIFISFIIFFIIGIIYSNINRNNKIHINKYEGYNSTREKLLSKIDNIKDDTCKLSLKYMLERIDSNNMEGDVSLKDYYESFYADDLTMVDYYNYVISSCNLEFNAKIYNTAMSSMVYPNYIKDKYNRAYEIYFKDYGYNDKNIDEMGTYTTIINELNTISMLLEELS
jgi:hypothetical protein